MGLRTGPRFFHHKLSMLCFSLLDSIVGFAQSRPLAPFSRLPTRLMAMTMARMGQLLQYILYELHTLPP